MVVQAFDTITSIFVTVATAGLAAPTVAIFNQFASKANMVSQVIKKATYGLVKTVKSAAGLFSKKAVEKAMTFMHKAGKRLSGKGNKFWTLEGKAEAVAGTYTSLEWLNDDIENQINGGEDGHDTSFDLGGAVQDAAMTAAQAMGVLGISDPLGIMWAIAVFSRKVCQPPVEIDLDDPDYDLDGTGPPMDEEDLLPPAPIYNSSVCGTVGRPGYSQMRRIYLPNECNLLGGFFNSKFNGSLPFPEWMSNPNAVSCFKSKNDQAVENSFDRQCAGLNTADYKDLCKTYGYPAYDTRNDPIRLYTQEECEDYLSGIWINRTSGDCSYESRHKRVGTCMMRTFTNDKKYTSISQKDYDANYVVAWSDDVYIGCASGSNCASDPSNWPYGQQQSWSRWCGAMLNSVNDTYPLFPTAKTVPKYYDYTDPCADSKFKGAALCGKSSAFGRPDETYTNRLLSSDDCRFKRGIYYSDSRCDLHIGEGTWNEVCGYLNAITQAEEEAAARAEAYNQAEIALQPAGCGPDVPGDIRIVFPGKTPEESIDAASLWYSSHDGFPPGSYVARIFTPEECINRFHGIWNRDHTCTRRSDGANWSVECLWPTDYCESRGVDVGATEWMSVYSLCYMQYASQIGKYGVRPADNADVDFHSYFDQNCQKVLPVQSSKMPRLCTDGVPVNCQTCNGCCMFGPLASWLQEPAGLPRCVDAPRLRYFTEKECVGEWPDAVGLPISYWTADDSVSHIIGGQKIVEGVCSPYPDHQETSPPSPVPHWTKACVGRVNRYGQKPVWNY